jgi:hypothetical protein
MKSVRQWVLLPTLCLSFGMAQAADPLTLDVTVGGVTNSSCYSDWDTFIGALDGKGLEGLLPGVYTGTQVADIKLDFRGLVMNAMFPAANNAEFRLTIPGIFDETISDAQAGGDRDVATDLMQDRLESSDVLSKISRALAASSPVDPVAGNPNSLMSTMVGNDFNQSFNSEISNIAAPGEVTRQAGQRTDEKSTNFVGVGLEYGQISQGDVSVKSTTLPLSYTVRNDLDPRRQLMLRLPITLVDVGGAKTLQAGLGAAYRFPMSANWSLTPSFNYALVGSVDLLSAAQMATAGITSTYFWRKSGYDIGMGNMLGYATTLPFTYDGKKYDPDISNSIVRNGVMISMPTRMFGGKMHFETALVDTRFFGTELYSNSQQELKFTIGTTRSASMAKSSLFRAGVSYVKTPNDDGFKVEMGYWF